MNPVFSLNTTACGERHRVILILPPGIEKCKEEEEEEGNMAICQCIAYEAAAIFFESLEVYEEIHAAAKEISQKIEEIKL
jgi:hypothetical protein